jgi:hypothetical protein
MAKKPADKIRANPMRAMLDEIRKTDMLWPMTTAPTYRSSGRHVQ